MIERKQPIISIITVCYQAEKTLERTLQSVAHQTYPHCEYIVIDGASTDQTKTILATYYSQITTLISEPDGGIYDAMNKGINLATGDYLCFLNAGDTFQDPITLAQLVASIPPDTFPDILYGETALVNQAGNFVKMRRLKAPEKLTWRSFKQGMLVCHQAFFAKRSIVSRYDVKYRFSSDFDWCIQVLKKATSIHNTHLTLINYLEEGVTTANHKKSLKERFQIMAIHYGVVSTILHHIWFVIRIKK